MSIVDPNIETVPVSLGDRSYEIRISSGNLVGSEFASFTESVLQGQRGKGKARLALVITDANVATIARKMVDQLVEIGLQAELAIVPAGEASKSLDQAAVLLDRLIELRADRRSIVVAVGGGVVGDLAGFVAATYARGISLFMVPTSLLAQVDSSVGGKVAVNRPAAKNIVGAFHQPVGVWIATESLRTLPARELRCGMAEVVKYGVILDAEFLDQIERETAQILSLESSALRRVIGHCCKLKADVVTKDEREETGLRAVLNFGHTIGHAIEGVSGYGSGYQHGESVAVGMVAESMLAERIGWVGPDLTARIRNLLERIGLPIKAPGLDPEALRQTMSHDKKNQGSTVRFVLPRRAGLVESTSAPEELISGVLREITAPS